MPKIELGFIQILEFIIIGIKNGKYQVALDLAQDCINELKLKEKKSNATTEITIEKEIR